MPGPTGPSPRMIGLTLASLMGVVFIAIIWWSMGRSPSTTQDQDSLFPTDPSEIPNLADLEQGASMFVTIADRDDPTRIAGTLQADQFEPIGGGQRRLVNPDAWIYMRDGRRVHITANDGLVMMPDPNQAPDSGTLEGDVTITAYDAPVAGQTDPAMQGVADETPSMVATFDRPVEFERRYQRLTSEGRFVIESPAVDFIGHSLTVMLNEVKGRIELIDVRKGERLVLRPHAKKVVDPVTQQPTPSTQASETVAIQHESDQPAAKASSDPTLAQTPEREQISTLPQPITSTAKPEKRTPYHIAIQDAVLVDLVGTGTLTSDALDIWAMLIDGSLSDQAIKDIRFAATEAQSESPAQASNAPAQSPRTQNTAQMAQESSSVSEVKDGELVVTWDGPLVVRPIEDPDATVLATEELAIAFSSDELVEFQASAQGIEGTAHELRYGATNGILELIGDNAIPIRLRADQAGTLSARSIRTDMGSGSITIDSAGQLESIQATDEPRARIDWSERAEFALVTSDSGELSGRLRSAYFQGDVLGTRADAVVRTQTLLAELDPDGPIESALRTIAMTSGSMQADSGSLTGDEITIGFVASTDRSTGAGVTPVSLDAKGAVLGVSQDGRIETQALNAVLVRELDGQTRVRTATAIGSTSFLGQNETQASGSRVDLNTDTDMIVIAGTRDEPGIAGQGGSIIHGNDIRINTRSRSILVAGQGSFDHDILVEGTNASGGHLRVNWDESMRFDDALGSIECEGNVVAVSTPDAYTLDTLKADRLEIDLSPAPGADQINDPRGVVDAKIERQLIEARAFGRAVPGGVAVPASVESRSYDPQNPERAIGVMYLEGSQLIADNTNQILRVPTKGMMMLMDRSEEQPGGESPASASVMPSTSGPGLTRMTWLGSMQLDRMQGQALVLSEVNIRHKSLTTGRVSQLGSERLDASFTSMGASQEVGAITMHRADASGRVRFTDLQRTLLADHAIYDAAAETMFAYADDDRLVTLRDSTNPTPISARTLLWDLKKDLVEIDAPSPVRAPARP